MRAVHKRVAAGGAGRPVIFLCAPHRTVWLSGWLLDGRKARRFWSGGPRGPRRTWSPACEWVRGKNEAVCGISRAPWYDVGVCIGYARVHVGMSFA